MKNSVVNIEIEEYKTRRAGMAIKEIVGAGVGLEIVLFGLLMTMTIEKYLKKKLLLEKIAFLRSFLVNVFTDREIWYNKYHTNIYNRNRFINNISTYIKKVIDKRLKLFNLFFKVKNTNKYLLNNYIEKFNKENKENE